MNFSAICQSLSLLGISPSRAFLPAFIAAVALRSQVDPAADPHWFTHDVTIIVLGVLALLEFAANKNDDARQLLETIDLYYKPVVSALISMGMITSSEAAVLDAIHQTPEVAGGGTLITVASLGFFGWSVSAILSAGVAVGTFFLALVRSEVLEWLRDLDDDNSTGLHTLISWCEDGWVFFAALLLVFLPILLILLTLLVMLGVYLLRRYLEHREEADKGSCGNCGASVYRSAPNCPSCLTEQPTVAAVGVLGQPGDEAAPDRKAHQLDLLGVRRCPRCATRLPERAVRQTCTACSYEIPDGYLFPGPFLEKLAARQNRVLVICLLCSAIPVLGMIPGIVYFRLVWIAPLRRYLSWRTGFTRKWLLRIANFAMLGLFSWVPLLSALVVPCMALLAFRVYKSAFESELEAQTGEPVE